MLEDEIQYIGTRMAPTIVAPASIRPFPSPQNPVTGIVLHVEANGGQPACNMTFHRAQTSAVVIGRKSSSDHKFGRAEDGSGNAGFICQVVSGRHAKLAFSDSGSVYLIDLGSRHGTHILHPGDTVSKMLDPEVATMLGDGDMITFGKTVGKGSYMVPPVIARVELLFGGKSEVASITSADTSTRSPVVVLDNGPKSGRPGSGRYGLYVPSSLSSPEGSSDDDSSSKFDHDSDIEEITPPSSSPGRVERRPIAPSLPVLPIIRGLQAHFYGELRNDSFPFSSLDDLRLPAIDRPDHSRSTSPMDLSSPTPTPIGAWPSAEAPPISGNNEQGSNSADAAVESSDDESDQGPESGANSPAPLNSEVISPEAISENPGLNDKDNGNESRSPSPPSEFDLQGREKEREQEQEKEQERDIHDKMAEVSATISQMHRETTAKRGSYQPLIDDPDSDELWGLADRVADAEYISSNLDDRLDVTEDHVSSLQDHVNKLQEQADSLTPILRDSTAEALAEVKTGVIALNALVLEMKALYKDMEVQKAINSASVEAARNALAAATAETLATSRKRKRSEVEADEVSATVAVQVTGTINDELEKPSRKRVKRIVSSVMHTAAAVTVGAVATWSALAFS